MRKYLLRIIPCLLLLTACSPKLKIDEANYIQKRKAEIAENEKKAKQTLEKEFRIDKHYATQLIQHSNTSFYPITADSPHCLAGKVIIKIFEDSAQTKRSPVTVETMYTGPGQVKQYSMLMYDEPYSNDIYYRNNYFLIDSIVKTDSKGQKSKIVFKYEKNKYSIVSVDEKLTMKSNVFHLDSRYRCIKSETFNGSGDLVGSIVFSYDNSGRIAEETDETRIIKYEYKNEHDPVYAAMRSYNKKSGELQTENLQWQDKKQVTAIFKNKGSMYLKVIVVTTPDGCVKTVYNYNGDNKITNVYEYIYQH